MEMVLPLGDSAGSFSLEKTVCSHGLFMMAPNRWEPVTLSLTRPFRLLHRPDHHDGPSTSVMARITQSAISPSLRIAVFGVSSLSPAHEASLASQVKRMLRLSETDERSVKDFCLMCHKMDAPDCIRGFGGRMFRSPTLFEDMVKCILLCNCQFSRSLSMANSLCDLQLELHDGHHKQFGPDISESCMTPRGHVVEFAPKTPASKESKRIRCKRTIKFPNGEAENIGSVSAAPNDINSTSGFNKTNENDDPLLESCEAIADLPPAMDNNSRVGVVGNFPSPSELASLDEDFLAKRCKLGYRAGRIVKLAKGIVEGSIQLGELEEMCDMPSLSRYDEIAERLRAIDGFGPFTCANVLMCMGYYHVVPADSETIRHLKQVHGKTSTNKTIQRDVAELYAKYAPFQFFAYWAELWSFYEQNFGNLSGMALADYGLITASNMKPKKGSPRKRKDLASGVP
ncbi:hypothetical protein MLD38_022846 [Melastoma candidum]|uniref:Uncharacterized protein n=1 Tax=Melastoma candidum TaxID=119954 RepID=A0ACB9QKS4_9MYRT|nr:hypothetical protein MLD38_022846 [Melastoma candidum]